MKERLLTLRKHLNLTQQQFAEKLNLSRGAIATQETNSRPLPERLIADICRVYNVSEDWLRNGEGPMFRPPKGINNEFAALAAELISDDTEDAEWVKDKFIRYKRLPEEERKIFVATLKKLFAQE